MASPFDGAGEAAVAAAAAAIGQGKFVVVRPSGWRCIAPIHSLTRCLWPRDPLPKSLVIDVWRWQVVDDEGRENEGDLVMAAQFVTTQACAFMVANTNGTLPLPCSLETHVIFTLFPI